MSATMLAFPQSGYVRRVPTSLDRANPCIVTAMSSGSRGVYGAITVAGERGLKRGCVVAYTDKGTGNGAHELMTDLVTLIEGYLADAAAAGQETRACWRVSRHSARMQTDERLKLLV